METDPNDRPYAKVTTRNKHGVSETIYTLEEAVTCEIDINLLRVINPNGVEVEYY
jgi:hypothetical protein